MIRAIGIAVLLTLMSFNCARKPPSPPPPEEISETTDDGSESKTLPPQIQPAQMDDLRADFTNTPVIDLGALSADEQRRLNAMPTEGMVEKIGVSRTVTTRPSLAADRAAQERADQRGSFDVSRGRPATWSLGVRSRGAVAVRLHFSNVTLPSGTKILVTDGQRQAFGPYDPGVYGREFWSNSIRGSVAYVEVQLPAAGGSGDLIVDEVAHITSMEFAVEMLGGEEPEAAFRESACPERCLVNEACLSAAERSRIERATRAVARIAYAKNGGHFLCSGGLLRDKSNSGTPYFLTAAHCFSTEASARSMEGFWQFKRASCDTRPTTRARTNGATLLATTGRRTDATFVRLLQPPPRGSHFMSWTNRPVHDTANLRLNRVSHPHGCSQHFSAHSVFIPRRTDCTLRLRPWGQYVYTTTPTGCTQKGSSGSLVWNTSFQVVGQLFGGCGGTVDGAFSQTYPSVRSWLDR